MKWLLFVILLFISIPSYADINYQVYRAGGPTPCWGCGQALNSGTVSNINFDWGTGIVMNSGLADGVEIHFTGWITVPGSGSQYITFYDWSDDGFYMYINGQTVISNWREQGAGYWNGAGGITLVGGQSYYIDVWYYENGGAARVALYWNQGGSLSVVGSSALTTTQPNPKAFGDGGASLPAASISTAQQAKMDQTNTLGHNSVYIDNSGNYTNISVQQNSDYNVIRGINGAQYMIINGDHNSATINQGTAGTIIGQNLAEISIIGASNSLNLTQTLDGKYAEVNVSGSSNSLSLSQLDSGKKSAFLEIGSNGNTINVTQQGTGNHFVEVDSNYGSATVNITQSGAAQKQFQLILNNSGIGVTVQQTNNSTVDSAKMQITCSTPPCTGYTYTRN
jgi:PA14 domain